MSRHIVITGANRGIGLSLVKQYKSQGDTVTAICRQASAELRDTGVDIVEHIDVTDGASVSTLTEKLNGKSIDVLINNAGVLHNENLGEIDYSTVQQQFEVNTLGPLRVTEALLPNLKQGSKIGLITSRMGSVEDNTSGSRYGYRMSKAALNAAGKSLSVDLKAKGIAVALLHPGFVQTEMVNHSGDISPDVAAERLAARIEGLNLENTGTFWHSNGDVLPW